MCQHFLNDSFCTPQVYTSFPYMLCTYTTMDVAVVHVHIQAELVYVNLVDLCVCVIWLNW